MLETPLPPSPFFPSGISSAATSALEPPIPGAVAGPLFPTAAATGGGQLRGLILQKEKELHDINEYRIHTLETLLQEKEREIGESKQRLGKLRDDFSYNLRLLEERDSELERYDASFTSLKSVIRDRDIELSELKISAAELQHGVKQERDRVSESEAYYQQKLQQHREEMEATRWKLDEQLREQRADFETHKRDMARSLRDAQEATERERREAAATFDDSMREREREHASKVGECEASLQQAEGERRRVEQLLSENRATVGKLEEQAESLASTLKQKERTTGDEAREADRREAVASAKAEELEARHREEERARQAQLGESTEEIRVLQQKLAASERSMSTSIAAAETARQAQAMELQSVVARLEGRLDSARTKAQEAEELQQQAWRRAAEVERELENKVRALEREVEAGKRERERLEAEGRERTAAVAAEAERQAAEAGGQLADSEGALEQARRDGVSLRAELGAMQDALSETRRQLAQAKTDVIDAEASLEAEAGKRLEEITRAAQTQRDAAVGQLRDAVDSAAELESQLVEVRAETQRANAARDGSEQRLSAAERELSDKQAELHRTQQLLQELERRLLSTFSFLLPSYTSYFLLIRPTHTSCCRSRSTDLAVWVVVWVVVWAGEEKSQRMMKRAFPLPFPSLRYPCLQWRERGGLEPVRPGRMRRLHTCVQSCRSRRGKQIR